MSPVQYLPLKGSEHSHPSDFKKLRATDAAQQLTVTLLLRRKPGHTALNTQHMVAAASPRPQREAFAAERGAAANEMDAVVAFAKAAGLQVIEADVARRTVIVQGTVSAVNKAFDVQLNEYEYQRGIYRSHDGVVKLPATIADYVEAVVGLTNRKVHARHYSTIAAARRNAPLDPPHTHSLTPGQVATLYNFPAGDGAGVTIGLFEMETSKVPAGYAKSDIAATMAALGNLPLPTIVDVPVRGVQNSGKSDGETGLDITVAGAIAPKATIAVYFAGGEVQDIIHALQEMILPKEGAPAPSIVSISYGWGPDDPGTPSFSESEYVEITKLFEDASINKITVLVASGDSGAFLENKGQAQTSYPASDIWVTACGGTTIGNVNGSSFEEWVWNDVSTATGGPAAGGGGVSARFEVPLYQASVSARALKHVVTGKSGRGVPDIAGNASENSGYLQVIGGAQPQSVGGTSAVAPLYAGLIARINSNLSSPVGYLNTTLYSLPASTFRDIVGAPGPTNNDFGPVKGYPAGHGWDACTGLGSVNGQALQNTISKAHGKQ
jgi:kumamolisin